MKGKERLTKQEQYTRVYREGNSYVDQFLVLKATPNDLEFSRYGISVSKRIGNAVVRNRIKRILREILRNINPAPGWDIILIVRNPSATGDYHCLKKSVEGLLSRTQIGIS
jgi:ribonuclease P protein component